MKVPVVGGLVVAVSLAAAAAPPQTRTTAPLVVIATESPVASGRPAAVTLADLRAWDQDLTALVRNGELVPVGSEPDALVAGRAFDRYAQYHRGLRVFGAEVVRQRNAFGQSVAILGVIFPGLDVDVTPVLDRTEGEAALVEGGRGVVSPDDQVALVVLAGTDAGDRLTWTARVASTEDGLIRRLFVDAGTGDVVHAYVDTWTQSAAVGTGTSVAGERVKVSAEPLGGQFLATDRLRPGANTTYDMRANPARAQQVLNGTTALLNTDIAVDADNVWTDAAVASAHVYAGFTYDYFYRRFQRSGLDNRNLRIRSLVNPARPEDAAALSSTYPLFFVNAAYYGNGYIAYGVGSVSSTGAVTFRNFAGAIDVVAHELTHGVTNFSSNLIYLNESGALNEAFSDIVGAAVEFMFQRPGTGLGLSDWQLGEDLQPSLTPTRSLIAPSTRGHPDHYSIRFTGTGDNGGVHINSSIVNHMFYLAVMGGTHRLSGLAVQGVGFDNRHQIETVIYRAFTQLPASATFTVARAATLQAARDLYGAGSAAERAVQQAWTAVGVE